MIFKQFDRVKAVHEGAQCLYAQRYGTVMRALGNGWYDVILDGFARTFYHSDQLEEAVPQRAEGGYE